MQTETIGVSNPAYEFVPAEGLGNPAHEDVQAEEHMPEDGGNPSQISVSFKQQELENSAEATIDKPEIIKSQAESNCINCKTNKKLIASFDEITIGNHICQPGAVGTRGKGRDQKPLYHHHGIVSDIKILSEEKALITMIHLTTVENTGEKKKGCKIMVHEMQKEYELTKDQIHVFNYDFPCYEPEDIVERARSCIGTGNYCLCTNNCEHFANWCVLGAKGESYEAAGMGQCCVDACSQIGGCSSAIKLGVRLILRTFFSRLADISEIVFVGELDDDANRKRNILVWLDRYLAWIIFGIIAIIFLIRVVLIQRNFWKRRYKRNMMCNYCFKYKSVRLWVEFLSFLLIALIGTVIIQLTEFCPFNLAIQVIILMTLVSGILIWFIPKLIINLSFPKERTTFCAKTLTKVVLIMSAVVIVGLIIGISLTAHFDEACSLISNEMPPVRNGTSAP